MQARHKVESKEGAEVEQQPGAVGSLESTKASPDLADLNKRFGVLHGLSSISNLVALSGLSVHLWYLASRLVL
jgi:hypothetical protein